MEKVFGLPELPCADASALAPTDPRQDFEQFIYDLGRLDEPTKGATASPTPDTGNAKVAAQVECEGSRDEHSTVLPTPPSEGGAET